MLNYRIEMNLICMDFIVKLSCRKKQRIKIIDNNDNFFLFFYSSHSYSMGIIGLIPVYLNNRAVYILTLFCLV